MPSELVLYNIYLNILIKNDQINNDNLFSPPNRRVVKDCRATQSTVTGGTVTK